LTQNTTHMKINDIYTDAVLLSVSKPLKELPVGSDLPRLAARIKVVQFEANKDFMFTTPMQIPLVTISKNSDTQYENRYEIDMDDIQITEDVNSENYERVKQRNNIYKVLKSLITRFQPEAIDIVTLESLTKQVDIDVHDSLNDYLTLHLGEDKPVVRILKSLHQSIVSTVLAKLRVAIIETELRLKDIRGAWEIFVKFHRSSDNTISQVITSHKRKEQVYMKKETGMEQLFIIEWEFELIYNTKTYDIEGARLHLFDITRDDQPLNVEDDVKYEADSLEAKARVIKDCFRGLIPELVTPKLSPRDLYRQRMDILGRDNFKKRTFSFASSEED
jgi:hypothetical protein